MGDCNHPLFKNYWQLLALATTSPSDRNPISFFPVSGVTRGTLSVSVRCDVRRSCGCTSFLGSFGCGLGCPASSGYCALHFHIMRQLGLDNSIRSPLRGLSSLAQRSNPRGRRPPAYQLRIREFWSAALRCTKESDDLLSHQFYLLGEGRPRRHDFIQ